MNQQSIMNQLVDKGPEVWLAYLRPFEEKAILPELSLIIVFQYAAGRAEEGNNIEWAEVAVRAAELEARGSNGIQSEDSWLRAMRVRSKFISKRGVQSGHFILDNTIILNWAVSGLQLSVQMVRIKAATIFERLSEIKFSSNPKVEEQTINDLRELRRIRHRLSVVKILFDCGALPANSIFSEWLELYEQLP